MYKKSRKLKLIRKYIKDGSGLWNACKSSGVDPSTLWGWRQRSKRVENYINTLLDGRVQLVEDALYKTALEGNTTAQIFFLTNRNKLRWQHKDRQDTNINIENHDHKTFVYLDSKALQEENAGNNRIKTELPAEQI